MLPPARGLPPDAVSPPPNKACLCARLPGAHPPISRQLLAPVDKSPPAPIATPAHPAAAARNGRGKNGAEKPIAADSPPRPLLSSPPLPFFFPQESELYAPAFALCRQQSSRPSEAMLELLATLSAVLSAAKSYLSPKSANANTWRLGLTQWRLGLRCTYVELTGLCGPPTRGGLFPRLPPAPSMCSVLSLSRIAVHRPVAIPAGVR